MKISFRHARAATMWLCAGACVLGADCNHERGSLRQRNERVNRTASGPDAKPILMVTAKLDGVRIRVAVTNASTQPLRLWKETNSWGFEAWSVLVQKSQSTHGETYVIHRKPKVWTRNFPSYAILQPQGTLTISLNLSDGSWVIPEPVGGLQNEPLRASAELTIKPTPEAAQYGVFVGSARSDWLESHPPHRWLPQSR